jgi:heptosyltransferase-2
VCSLLGVSRIEEASYRIVHMGSGEVRRELPIAFWRELAERLSGVRALVFTGLGERESRNIAAATVGLSNCMNACGQLSWGGFVAAVRHAQVVYGVESMAGHVASAVGTKCVVAYAGMAGVAQLRPEGPDAVVFTNHVPCAPCHRPSGCEAMNCTRNFTPADLIRFGP